MTIIRVIFRKKSIKSYKQTYLLLTTKPKYMRGRVGCPNDTRPLKNQSDSLT